MWLKKVKNLLLWLEEVKLVKMKTQKTKCNDEVANRVSYDDLAVLDVVHFS